MRTRLLGTLAVVAVLAMGGACGDDDDDDAATDTTEATAAAFTADLEGGAAETPPGDPDGSGTASVTLDEATGEVCYDIRVENIAAPAAAHIHEGAAGTNGPVLITFDPAKIGQGETCLANQKLEDVTRIVASPDGFYVNVHTADFPGGAVRGQLEAA